MKNIIIIFFLNPYNCCCCESLLNKPTKSRERERKEILVYLFKKGNFQKLKFLFFVFRRNKLKIIK